MAGARLLSLIQNAPSPARLCAQLRMSYGSGGRAAGIDPRAPADIKFRLGGNQGATGAGASGVSVSASSSTGATGAETDVERYMAATYGIQLRHPDWPCVAVGAVAHIPPELCR